MPDGSGALLVETASGALRDAPPVSYQVIVGKRVAVDSDYQLDLARDGELSYGFAVGDYDTARELIIDPGLEYSTFLGGFGNQAGAAIEVDSSGNAYVTGFTQSPTFPTTPGAFDRTGSVRNDLDAFVSKLNATGTGLVYSTFLGGSNFEWGRDLAIDAAGNVYVAGQTKSSSFPTTSGAFDRSFNIANCPRCGIDQYDAFVTKLNPTGSGLVYSTFLGGTDIDDIRAIAIDGAGPRTWPARRRRRAFQRRAGSFDTTPNGGVDVFVAKFNATGSGLDYSTRLGGTDNETADGIDVDASGNVVVGGATRSANFPSTPGALQPTHSGGDFIDLFEGYVTKLNPTGSALVYSTFLGGTKRDSVGNVIPRRARQHLPERRNGVAGVPDHTGRLRHRVRQPRCDVRQRVVRRQAQPDRLGVRLLDVPRRSRRGQWARSRPTAASGWPAARAHRTRSSPPTPGPTVERRLGRLHRQAQPDGLGVRLRNLLRRHAVRRSRRPGPRPRRRRVRRRHHPLPRLPDDRRRDRPGVQRRSLHQRLRHVGSQIRGRPGCTASHPHPHPHPRPHPLPRHPAHPHSSAPRTAPPSASP